jgi:hypothetical protein
MAFDLWWVSFWRGKGREGKQPDHGGCVGGGRLKYGVRVFFQRLVDGVGELRSL